MKSIARLLIALILLALPGLLAAQGDYGNSGERTDRWKIYGSDDRERSSGRRYDYYSEKGQRVEGKVVSVDSDAHMIRLDADTNRDRTISVYAANTPIYEGGRRRAISNLRRGDRIAVFGRESRGVIADARVIYKITENRYDSTYDQNGSNQTVRLSGTIEEIDVRDGRLIIDSGRRTIVVTTNGDTRILKENGKKTRLKKLNDGDRVTVVGYYVRGNEIAAEEIRKQ